MNPEKYMSAINEVDDLNFKLGCGVTILSAIHDAMERGNLDAICYKDGLFGAYDYISAIQEQIQAVIDGCEMQPTATPQNCG